MEFDITVTQRWAEIASAEQLRVTAIEGIRNEFCGIESGLIEIAAGECFTADVDLADHAIGHRFQKRIENVNLHVRNGLPNRNVVEVCDVSHLIARNVSSDFR